MLLVLIHKLLSWTYPSVLNTEVSSFHGIVIYRGVHILGRLYSTFQGVGIEGSTVYRGVLISGCWNRGVPLYTEVSSFQGVGIEEFHCIQRCPHFRVLE